MARPDFIVDIPGIDTASSLGVNGATPASARRGVAPGGRPWLAILWTCCHVYGRAYRNPDATAYLARCPRCGSPITIGIAPGGTNARFFTST